LAGDDVEEPPFGFAGLDGDGLPACAIRAAGGVVCEVGREGELRPDHA
jgi:hypothetical protein